MTNLGVETKKSVQIDNVLTENDKLLNRLEENIANLENRLNRVMRSYPPEKEGIEKDIQEFVELANEIRLRNARIENIAIQVESILDRLEL